MGKEILFSTLNNKVYVCGQLISLPNETYNEADKRYCSTFVLAVNRHNLPLTFNKDDYNYFYCSVNEDIVGGQKAESYAKLRVGDILEVYGILDSVPREIDSKNKTRKSKALNNYTAVIDVVNIVRYKASEEEKTRLSKELKMAQKIFGTSFDVNFSEDAFDRDEDGLTGGFEIPNI